MRTAGPESQLEFCVVQQVVSRIAFGNVDEHSLPWQPPDCALHSQPTRGLQAEGLQRPASGSWINRRRASATAKLGEIGPIPTYSPREEGHGGAQRRTLKGDRPHQNWSINSRRTNPPGELKGRFAVPVLL